jgi:hypothetical protein
LKRFLRYKVLCSCRWAWKAAIQFSNFDCRHLVFDYVIKNRSSSCEGLCKSFVIAMLENDRYAIRPGDCDRARDVVFTPIPSKSRPQIVVATSEPIRRHHLRHISNISCFKNGVFLPTFKLECCSARKFLFEIRAWLAFLFMSGVSC